MAQKTDFPLTEVGIFDIFACHLGGFHESRRSSLVRSRRMAPAREERHGQGDARLRCRDGLRRISDADLR